MTETERIDVSELPEEKRTELAKSFVGDEPGGVMHIQKLKEDAILGRFDDTPRSFTTDMYGDSREAALGRAYKIRDIIENNTDATVECELTGTEYDLPETVFYEVRITINGGE